MGLYGVPRARTSKRDNNLFALVFERERESTQLFGTTKQSAIFFLSPLVKESNAAHSVFTPLLYKAQAVAELIFFIILIVIMS